MDIFLSLVVIILVSFEGWRMWFVWKTNRDEKAHREWIRQQVIEDASKALMVLSQTETLDNTELFKALEDMAYHARLGNLQLLFNNYKMRGTMMQFRLDLNSLISSLLVIFKNDQTIWRLAAAITAAVETKIKARQ